MFSKDIDLRYLVKVDSSRLVQMAFPLNTVLLHFKDGVYVAAD